MNVEAIGVHLPHAHRCGDAAQERLELLEPALSTRLPPAMHMCATCARTHPLGATLAFARVSCAAQAVPRAATLRSRAEGGRRAEGRARAAPPRIARRPPKAAPRRGRAKGCTAEGRAPCQGLRRRTAPRAAPPRAAPPRVARPTEGCAAPHLANSARVRCAAQRVMQPARQSRQWRSCGRGAGWRRAAAAIV